MHAGPLERERLDEARDAALAGEERPAARGRIVVGAAHRGRGQDARTGAGAGQLEVRRRRPREMEEALHIAGQRRAPAGQVHRVEVLAHGQGQEVDDAAERTVNEADLLHEAGHAAGIGEIGEIDAG